MIYKISTFMNKASKKKNNKLSTVGRHLTADDNEINRFVIKTFLEKDGFNVVDVADGKYVLDLFSRGEKFDMVWLDLKMPHVDGVQCAQKLRTVFGYTGPIVGITAHVDSVTLDQCKNAGFSTVISKPVTEQVIKKCADDFFLGNKINFYNRGCQIETTRMILQMITE
jgi:CheY-like chemotaxis protein